ncbi:MAG: hypothetical protein Fur0018_17920 [Anaerolineales bacterium]
MSDWNLPLEKLNALTLAADVRFGGSDYLDDHIWELTSKKGEPLAVALQTTFGLRARSLRLFPRWVEDEQPVESPSQFAAPPVLHEACPNLAHLSCMPAEGLNVHLWYVVPTAHNVYGKMQVFNREKRPRLLRLEWAALLNPVESEGQRAQVRQHASGAWYLHGESGGLHTVLRMASGAQASPGPYTALAVTCEIPAQRSIEIVWGHAAAPQFETAWEEASELLQRNMEADIARIRMINAGGLQIDTGSPAWNTLFALGHQRAFGLLAGPPPHLAHPVPVLSRQPDHGYSQRPDGVNYPPAWHDGHILWHAVYLCTYLLPGYPELAAGILENFLQQQDPDSGYIPNNPNRQNDGVRVLATPMLANLAWQIYLRQRETAFLEHTFDPLYRFLQAWFREENDRDGDGLPEWQSIRQINFLNHPLFAHWHPWAQGVDIASTETPSLLALLHREAECLLRMAQVLKRDAAIAPLQAICDNLKLGLKTAWDERENTYLNWDRDLHHSLPAEDLGTFSQPGEYTIGRTFERPVRPLVNLTYTPPHHTGVKIILDGRRADGTALREKISPARWRWTQARATATAEHPFASLDALYLENLPAENVEVHLSTPDLRRQSVDLLLPLIGGMVEPAQARLLIEETLLNPQKYWQTHGVPLAPWHTAPPRSLQMVSLLWNTWLGYGLLRYGYRQQSAALVTRLMDTLAAALEDENGLPALFHCRSGEGEGEINTLEGLPPLGLFLETLGVRIYSPWRVRLEGQNPFPWTVEIRFRGLHIVRGVARTEITFPDGQSTTIKDPAACVVSAD